MSQIPPHTAHSKAVGALRWISDILISKHIPFQITGGLAAKIYGSDRELADIDIDVPKKYFALIEPEVRKHSIFGPDNFRDEHWDLELITLDYEGQLIDIGSAESNIFNSQKNIWEPFNADLSTAERHEIFGMHLPCICKKDLLWYKAILDREVDRDDVSHMKKTLTISPRCSSTTG